MNIRALMATVKAACPILGYKFLDELVLLNEDQTIRKVYAIQVDGNKERFDNMIIAAMIQFQMEHKLDDTEYMHCTEVLNNGQLIEANSTQYVIWDHIPTPQLVN